jgi:hypothetical protein
MPNILFPPKSSKQQSNAGSRKSFKWLDIWQRWNWNLDGVETYKRTNVYPPWKRHSDKVEWEVLNGSQIANKSYL